ncbi:carboxypeptidase-like regulatory domain-containing protein [Cupriavidus sp. YR651]|uniref:carboxypeptidase-like regulatory domain-containing protein n=1 Tax=Cupriavidus sp. YR651 TaxID=1855315 RepID=UPI0021014443|nr:carboxypeptidase-like regulatory domain-containing protein [Cupriavidus sp. YR651]
MQVIEQHGTPYVSGGNDEAGRLRMLDIAARFNVRLSMFNAGSGAPLGGATVVVAAPDGRRLLSAIATGPLFYILLQPGAYSLAVGYQGRDQMRDIVVGERPLDYTFQLPVNTLEDDWLLCQAAECQRR